MKKLQLNVDDLQVKSFVTAAGAYGGGTVRAHQIIEPSGYTYCIPCTGSETTAETCEPATNDPYICRLQTSNTCDQ